MADGFSSKLNKGADIIPESLKGVTGQLGTIAGVAE